MERIDYIRTEDRAYPFTEKQIKALFPSALWPTPFKADGFDVVFNTPKPPITNLQIVVESDPFLTDKETWEKTWQVVDKFSDIPEGKTKLEQETDLLDAEFEQLSENKLLYAKNQFIETVASVKKYIPQEEIDTFLVQEQQALEYMADNQAEVPFIARLASIRDLELSVLVDRILAHAEAYKTILAETLGQKHLIEDKVKSAENLDDLNEI